MASDSKSRKNQYFVPGDGIAREVITADICKYLDNDATVKPGTYQGRDGYYVFAYRNLTSEMMKDLQGDSEKWETEKREKAKQRAYRPNPTGPVSARNAAPRNSNFVPDSYVNSATHSNRQAYGPTVPETPSPGLSGGYPPPGRLPQDHGRQQHQASPYGDSQYTVQPQSTAYPPSSRAQGYPAPYEPISGPGAPRTAPQGYYDTPGYASEPPYGYPGPQAQPQHAPRGAYPPQPQQTAPPPQSRYLREEYVDPRADPRMDTRMDTRVDPRMDPRYAEQPRNYYPDGRSHR